MKLIPLLSVVENVTSGPVRFSGSRLYFATADVEGSNLGNGTDVTFDDRPSRANLVGEPGDVLFAKMQGTDKVFQVTEDASEAIFSTGFFNLRPRRTKIHPRYLFWFLRSRYFQAEKDRLCTGATQKALTLGSLEKILVPLPSTVEQQEIIAGSLDKADAIHRKREQALALADDFLKSVFLEMFGDPTKTGDHEPALSEVATISRGRFSPRPRNDPRYYNGEFPFIQTGEIASSVSYLSEYRQTLNEAGTKVSKSFPPGTVFIAIVGATIGATTVSTRRFWCPDSVIGIVPKSNMVPAEFIEFLLRFWRPVFLATAPSTARANINLQTLNVVRIPKADTEAPAKFAEIFKRTYALKQKWERMDSGLLPALSQRAFRGEL